MSQIQETFHQIEKNLKKNNVPGGIITLAHNGEITNSQSFGYRNLEKQLPINEETVFGLASITKIFTAIAIMQLQEKGKLSVEDLVVNHIPEFHIKDTNMVKKITIHHFLTHSSGLPPMSSLEYAIKLPNEDHPSTYKHVGEDGNQKLLDSYDDLLQFIKEKDVDLIAEPGQLFSYSNEAYGLLGLIIERTSGKSYKTYVYDHIIHPCGMEHTQFTIEDYSSYENITSSYGKSGTDTLETMKADTFWMDSIPMRSTGFIKSTAKDMMKFSLIFINDGKVGEHYILSQASVKQMMKPHMRVQLGRYYGYGLSIVPDYYGSTLIEHGGSLRAVSSNFSIIPEKGVSGICLTNLIGVTVASYLHQSLNVFFNRNQDDSFITYDEFDVATEELFKFEGIYASEEGAHIELKVTDDRLEFIVNEEKFQTKFVEENIFLVYFKQSESLVEVLINPENEPYALVYNTRVVKKV